jgi:L-malate glycosyltransferase
MEQILIISFWNPTDKIPSKGIFIHDQVKALSSRRSDLIFLAVNILPSKKIFTVTITENILGSGKQINFNILSFFWKIIYINPWLTAFFIKKALRKNYPDLKPAVIHSNIIFPCAIVGYLLAKQYSCKHIISEHWSKAVKVLKHPVFKNIALKTYRTSNAILCVSNFLALNIGLATGHKNIQIIPNILDTDLFRYREKQKDNTGLRFTCVATWQFPKRLDLIVNALDKFCVASNQKVILNVIGEGIQKKKLQEIGYNRMLTINWSGNIPRYEIAHTLNDTDIFMHASEVETFSIVTVEALSVGTPVIASNTGALPELINRQNGILVENTLEAWIEGLREITGQNYDNEAIAGNIIGKYSSESVAERIEKVYNDIITDTK